MRSLESYRAGQEYERLKSRVGALEYEVARLRERLAELETEDVYSVRWEEDR